MPAPHFIIKNKFQKRRERYEDILTRDILRDVCERLTGRRDYTVTFDNTGYNIGRLATLTYNGAVSYVSFSEYEIGSRNSFFQSFPSALVKYHQETNPNKSIHFYFLQPDGNIETAYFKFMYRLMKTAGTNFLNEGDHLTTAIQPFNSVSDVIAQRDLNRGRNRGNVSSYVTIDENNTLQIYGKTYGANKYETVLLCLAIHKITRYSMELYEIQEGDLRKLPADARDVIVSLGIHVITSDLVLEKREFEANDSLRSPTYIYNLLEKLGEKKCLLCDCEIPQIIQGAHIWPVASIKKANNLSIETKIQHATAGDNGLWLCNNHHKLFDINMLYITHDGRLKYKNGIEQAHGAYLRSFIRNNRLPHEILTPAFIGYLHKRNRLLNEGEYDDVEID
ncbi:MAG TPA: HNH endonuclease signature motif containing protein [Chitinophaga sp.]|uniref:HNH endonuclease signature motif containing protein n=1 Tax=Chitinophaga sp. TaxID=1869181 RepID=UPI002DBCFB35|nr:HNH endonuclease signature motif containing protein [Chitinophaga sp.]HEU4551779.1 HNH endonuclease signature motif containing protein [Chitinophaga sp.]